MLAKEINIKPNINESFDHFLKRAKKQGINKAEARALFRPEALKQAGYDRMDAQLKQFITKIQNRYKRALDDALRPIRDVLSERSTPSEDVIDAARFEPVRGAHERTWKEVASWFGKRRFEEIEKNNKFGAINKETDSEFVESFVMQQVIDSMESTWESRAKNITNTAKKQIGREIRRGIERGRGIDEIVKEIRLKQGEISSTRATVIARTESISARNFGAEQGAKASGQDLVKIWLTARDARVRGAGQSSFDHQGADGQRVELSGSFTISGESLSRPGDVRGSPGNIINCRCALLTPPRDRAHEF